SRGRVRPRILIVQFWGDARLGILVLFIRWSDWRHMGRKVFSLSIRCRRWFMVSRLSQISYAVFCLKKKTSTSSPLLTETSGMRYITNSPSVKVIVLPHPEIEDRRGADSVAIIVQR